MTEAPTQRLPAQRQTCKQCVWEEKKLMLRGNLFQDISVIKALFKPVDVLYIIPQLFHER